MIVVCLHMMHTYIDRGIGPGTNNYVDFFPVKTGTSAESGSSSRCHSDSMYVTVDVPQPTLGTETNGTTFCSNCLPLFIC